MSYCLSFRTASSDASLGDDDTLPHHSLEDVASSSRNTSIPSTPTFNLSRELAHAFQTPSYADIRSRVHFHIEPDNIELLLSQVLEPNKECVQEALRHAKQTTLTNLVSTYFQYSEKATCLCLNLYQSVHTARHLFCTPLFDLFDVFPGDSDSHAAIDESLCNLAFDVFVKLDTVENPFSSPDESLSFRDTQLCFSQLKNKLDSRLRKSKSRARLLHHATAGSALCLVPVPLLLLWLLLPLMTSHLVAGPLCTPYLPQSFRKKELSNISQLSAASRGTFVLNTDLDTIFRLVFRLHTEIRYEKDSIRLGLERGRDVHSVMLVLKQLRKSHLNLTHQLTDLEDHICLWFTNVNKARSLLLKEIHLPPRT